MIKLTDEELAKIPELPAEIQQSTYMILIIFLWMVHLNMGFLALVFIVAYLWPHAKYCDEWTRKHTKRKNQS